LGTGIKAAGDEDLAGGKRDKDLRGGALLDRLHAQEERDSLENLQVKNK